MHAVMNQGACELLWSCTTFAQAVTGFDMILLNREHGCNWQPSISTISGHLTALQGHEGRLPESQMEENLKQHNFDMQALLEA